MPVNSLPSGGFHVQRCPPPGRPHGSYFYVFKEGQRGRGAEEQRGRRQQESLLGSTGAVVRSCDGICLFGAGDPFLLMLLCGSRTGEASKMASVKTDGDQQVVIRTQIFCFHSHDGRFAVIGNARMCGVPCVRPQWEAQRGFRNARGASNGHCRLLHAWRDTRSRLHRDGRIQMLHGATHA